MGRAVHNCLPDASQPRACSGVARAAVALPVLLCAALVWPVAAHAGETDQYLTWGVELDDSAEAINRFINAEAERFLAKRNERDREPCTADEIVNGFYLHLFAGIHASRLRNWLHHADEVARYPDKSVSIIQYQRMSIYRGRSFPYFLPVSRTVRVGDVYCGIDKLSHFFGFGRRFYNHYGRLRARGCGEEEAMAKLVRAGIRWEASLVGLLVDGIFSHADLEAGFQGFCLARDLCACPAPYFEIQEGEWVLARPLDLRAYVTPDFDESYNPCHYWALRKRYVLPLLNEQYAGRIAEPAVQERFARYARYEPSFAKRYVAERFNEKGRNPQIVQHLHAFGTFPGRDALQTRTRAAAHAPQQ
ncbi:MAG: hypothetical protein JXR94_20880 [Candidatus Hydrogenedentes bacterium]|nr:hypothetical protein [Candidatus Hydrogenedentota bacterium]